MGPSDLVRSADLFRQALARDPDYSRARAGIVVGTLVSAIYVPERRDEAERVLGQTVAEANASVPHDWATHLARAALHMNRYEWAAAEDAFRHAEAGAPASVPELTEIESLMLLNLGRISDALEMLRVAMSNDPLSSTRSFEVQLALQVLGRRDEAEAEYQRCLDLPGADAREDIHHWALFRVWDGGDAALVEQRFDNYLRRQTVQSKWVRSVRAVYQDRDAALAVLCAALGDTANQDATRLSFLAGYAGHLGDAELALTAARRSLIDLRNQAANFLWWPEMANVRRLPGFKDLVREMGMVDYWRTTGRWGDFCRPVGDDDFEFFWPAQYIAFLNGTAH